MTAPLTEKELAELEARPFLHTREDMKRVIADLRAARAELEWAVELFGDEYPNWRSRVLAALPPEE